MSSEFDALLARVDALEAQAAPNPDPLDTTPADPLPADELVMGGSLGPQSLDVWPQCRVTNSAPFVVADAGAFKEIGATTGVLDVEYYDLGTNGTHDTAVNTGRILAPQNGIYLVEAWVQWPVLAAGATSAIALGINGTVGEFVAVANTPGGAQAAKMMAAMRASVADYFCMFLVQFSGAPATVAANHAVLGATLLHP